MQKIADLRIQIPEGEATTFTCEVRLAAKPLPVYILGDSLQEAPSSAHESSLCDFLRGG